MPKFTNNNIINPALVGNILLNKKGIKLPTQNWLTDKEV